MYSEDGDRLGEHPVGDLARRFAGQNFTRSTSYRSQMPLLQGTVSRDLVALLIAMLILAKRCEGGKILAREKPSMIA